MARLPVVGGDNANWGTILNDYLSVEHNSDGSLKLRTDGTLSSGIADGSITASKLSSSVNSYLASAQTAVQSVNGKTGQAVTLTASDVSAVSTSAAGAASGVATLDGSSKLTASQVPSTLVLKAQTGIRYFDEYGAIGDGIADDTAEVNAALVASASEGFTVKGRPNAIYKVSQAGSKSFVNPDGSIIVKNYAVEVPSGAKVDWAGATITCALNADIVILSNKTMATTPGDVIECKNVIVDGGGQVGSSRTIPMTWFWGLSRSKLESITVQNTVFVAGQLAALTHCQIDDLRAKDITGQGWIMGGNTFDQIFDCEIGTCVAENIADFGGFSQPGNGICVGGQRLKIKAIIARNCAGGHKYLPGCADVHTDYAEFDGRAENGESSHGTNNSGTKVQGDAPVVTGTATANGTNGLTAVTGSGWAVGQYIYGAQIPSGTKITAVGSGTLTLDQTVPTGTSLAIGGYLYSPPDRISFSKIVSRNCTGMGMYLHYSGNIRINNYYGYKNGRSGAAYDLDAANVAYLEIDSYRADWPGLSGVVFGTGMVRYHFGSLIVRNCGDVTTANVNGFMPGSGDGSVDYMEVMDDRSSPVAMQAIAALSTNAPLFVGRFRSFNVTASLRLQSEGHMVANPLISSGTAGLNGTVTLSAATTTTTIANANVKSFNYNSGWVEPMVELIPMNASAQALGVIRYSVPSSFNLRLYHSSAVGTELFAYRILAYTWRPAQLA